LNSSSPVWRVELRLRPSRILLSLSLGLHLAAAVALWRSGLGLFLQLAGTALVLILLWCSWRQEQRRAGFVVREEEGAWGLQAGHWQGRAELLRSQVWRYLVVMDFRVVDEGRSRRQRVVVLPDAVSADVFRRLRVRLSYGRRPGAASTFQ
jgi:hypothetical protein